MYQKQIVSEHERSAIVGFIRCGASVEEIIGATNLFFESIEKLIDGFNEKKTNIIANAAVESTGDI